MKSTGGLPFSSPSRQSRGTSLKSGRAPRPRIQAGGQLLGTKPERDGFGRALVRVRIRSRILVSTPVTGESDACNRKYSVNLSQTPKEFFAIQKFGGPDLVFSSTEVYKARRLGQTIEGKILI